MSGDVLAYIRVSGEAQLDGYGLDIQTDSVHALARIEGLPVPTIYSDAGISGTKEQADRPGLDALIVHCQDVSGCTVILPKLDRLARSLAIQETVLKVIWDTGATVLSCDTGELHYLRTGDDPDDPTRTLIRQVLGAVAQFERGQIRMRLRAGRRRKIAAVGWAGGLEPYGWTDPGEQAVMEHVDLWRARKMTWREIVERLNIGGNVKRNGKPWNMSELCQVYRAWTKRTGLVA
jgi:DNA invertase Pin-like site-specific DNA recombinase